MLMAVFSRQDELPMNIAMCNSFGAAHGIKVIQVYLLWFGTATVVLFLHDTLAEIYCSKPQKPGIASRNCMPVRLKSYSKPQKPEIASRNCMPVWLKSAYNLGENQFGGTHIEKYRNCSQSLLQSKLDFLVHVLIVGIRFLNFLLLQPLKVFEFSS